MSLHLSFQEIKTYRRVCLAIFVFCMMASFSFLATRGTQESLAASTAGFKAGNIMSDAVMSNYNSMSKDDIQRFLTTKNPCNDTDYGKYQRLTSSYPNSKWHFENGHFVCLSEERFGEGTTIGSGQTAAEIIYQAAQDYKINPQVLLVVLQKEQSLVTDTYPSSTQYDIATGFGCPDSAKVCDKEYYGLKNQIRSAAALFRQVLDGGWSNYPAYKTVYIQYNPQSSCGGSSIYIENRATSALYRYTPYQPNSAALGAGYGTGGSCGSYGNRNFYLYFTDWFGSTHVSIDGSSVEIIEGIYSLSPKANINQVLEVKGSARTNGANVQLGARQNSTSSQWEIKRTANGYYTLKNVNSGLVLDLAGALTNNGTNLQTYTSNNSCAQQWKIYRTPDGYYTFESACAPAMVADLAGGFTSSGTNLQLYITNNSQAQKWQLVVGKTVEEGIYTVQSGQDNKIVMDVAGGSTQNGTSTQTYSDNKSIAQKWQLQYNSTEDYYTIKNPVTGKVLDVDAGVLKEGNRIQMYSSNSSCAQRWKIIPTGNGQYRIALACSMDKVINPTNNTANPGSILRLAVQNDTSTSQLWNFVASPAIDEKTYTVISDLSNNNKSVVIDVKNNGTADATNIQTWGYDASTTAQQWKLHYDSASHSYALINPYSNKALDVAGATMQNGTNINLYSTNMTCAQRWYLIEDVNKYIIASACNPTFVLDVAGGSTANGTNLHLYQYNGTAAQKWTLNLRQ